METGDVVKFILSGATEEDLWKISSAMKTRKRTLGELVAASITVGMTVVIHGLSPKYLNDLRGEVVEHAGKHVVVELDEDSTEFLRFAGNRRFFIPEGQKSYRLAGVPAECVRPAGA